MSGQACIDCPGGKYAASTGAAGWQYCESCQAGSYAPSGSTGCTDCAVGSAVAYTGASACEACGTGHTTSTTGLASCDMYDRRAQREGVWLRSVPSPT